MIVNPNEFHIFCDVDNTLVMHNYTPGSKTIKVINPYDGAEHWVAVHQRHVELMRQYKARGLYITVHSNNGVRWAEAVVRAVGLEDCVHEVRTKAIKHVDDETDVQHIVGSHVYIPFKETV